MVCGKDALDTDTISSISASVDALATCDQISYVKVETLRKIHPIMDIHRAVHKVCGRKTFSSSTFARWSRTFKEGKSVKLGYEKPLGRDLETAELLKQIVGIKDDGASSGTSVESGP